MDAATSESGTGVGAVPLDDDEPHLAWMVATSTAPAGSRVESDLTSTVALQRPRDLGRTSFCSTSVSPSGPPQGVPAAAVRAIPAVVGCLTLVGIFAVAPGLIIRRPAVGSTTQVELLHRARARGAAAIGLAAAPPVRASERRGRRRGHFTMPTRGCRQPQAVW